MRTRDPNKIKAVEHKVRGLALEDALWGAAEALARQTGTGNKPSRRRTDSSQFPFETALNQHIWKMEARYGSVLEAAPDALLVINAHGSVIFANARAGSLFGFRRDDMAGASLTSVLTGDLADRLVSGDVAGLARLVGSGANGIGELAGIRRDGTGFPAEVTLSTVESNEGTLIAIAIRDATLRRVAEKRLTNAEAFSRSLFDAVPDAVLVANRRGRITGLNNGAEQLFGYGRDSLIGQPAGMVLDDALVAGLVIDEEETGARPSARGIARRKDGSEIAIEVTIGSLQDEHGRLAVASIRDLSSAQAASTRISGLDDVHRRLFEIAPDAMLVVDEAGVIVLANGQAERQFGYAHEEMIGQAATRILPSGFADRLAAGALHATEAALAREIGTGIEVIGRRRSGERFPLEIMLASLPAPEGLLTIATMRDISIRKAAERHRTVVPSAGAAAAETQHIIGSGLAETTLRSIGDAIVCADPAGKVGFMNAAAETLTGWPAAEAVGHPISEIVRVVDASSGTTLFDGADPARAAQLHSNFVLIRRDNSEVPIEGSVAPIEGRNGNSSGEVFLFRDVSVARATVQQMAHSAQHDALTGLPNRVLLNDRIGTAISIAPRHKKKVGILFLDLDGFKQINDSLGHAVGDKLLQSVADRLLGCVRGSDTVSRIGGDEFVVLLSEVERPEDSAITARRMLEAVATTHTVDQHELHVTASIGVAVYPDDGANAETLIRNADAAMYQAKENGRHGYQFYKPAMNLRAVERQDVEDNLRHALDRGEFTLHFQPKVNLQTGQIAGAEALLRWEHPTRGPVSPALFVPVAESSGLIHQIGSWVMREACRQTQAWIGAGLPIPSVSVNVSAAEFWGTHFLDGVYEALNDTGLDPHSLELELTESVLMKHTESTNAILQALRATGVHMSVDDFGTGFSSLSHLRKFPIHTLKIDQSFVREITLAGEQTSIVAAVLNMAQSLNLRVVAEGVETREELAFLQSHHCHEAQGYYFSKPLPAQQFTRLLQDGLVATMAAREYSKSTERRTAHSIN